MTAFRCHKIFIAGVLLVLSTTAASLGQDEGGEPIGILLAAGDIAKCNPAGGQDEATAAILAREVAEADQRSLPIRILVLGDLAYDHGTTQEFHCFNQSWGAFRAAMLPVPGNHDYSNPGHDAAPYFAYFDDNALVSQNGATAGYYALNFPDDADGPWRLIGLNAYVRGHGGLQGQLDWLEGDLEENSTPCVLAFWHPFVLSSGHHGHNDGDSVEPRVGRLMLPAFKLLDAAGASLVLSGHDHDFEQFARHDAEGARTAAGVRSFVVGTGGGRLYRSAQTSRWPSSEFYSDTDHGVLKLTLYPGRYEWAFLTTDGETLGLPVNQDACAETEG